MKKIFLILVPWILVVACDKKPDPPTPPIPTTRVTGPGTLGDEGGTAAQDVSTGDASKPIMNSAPP